MKLALVFAAASALAIAQPPDQQGPPPPPPGQHDGQGRPEPPAPPPPPPGAPRPRRLGADEGRGRIGEMPPPPRRGRPELDRALGPRGRWWTNPDMAQKLSLTADQKKRMDDIFQQNRLRLIDLNASLQKEEAIMEPLVGADQPDETKILAQIDKVAQARAELEKANARFLFGIRRVLTADQWKKLEAEAPPQPPPAAPGTPRPTWPLEPRPSGRGK